MWTASRRDDRQDSERGSRSTAPAHEDEMSRGASNFLGVDLSEGECAALRESPASSPAVRSGSYLPQLSMQSAWPHTVSWARGPRVNTGSQALSWTRKWDRAASDRREPPGGLRGEPKPARDGLRERALLNTEAGGLEVRPITEKGIEQAAQPMGHRDDRDLVAAGLCGAARTSQSPCPHPFPEGIAVDCVTVAEEISGC